MSKDNIFTENEIEEVLSSIGLHIEHISTRPHREASNVSYHDMSLSQESRNFLKNNGFTSLWSHQRLALESFFKDENLCISTSTSSGKTEIFQLAAIEVLQQDPAAKVLAVYSAKALNRQQKERWEKTGFRVGQIDGDHTRDRDKILLENQIVTITPDTIHAFLLGRINEKKYDKAICDFIKHIELIIIDEIHLYRGVFGTNSAYLFRRLNNVRRLLRNDTSFPKYITASATIPNPETHSKVITGVETRFTNIGADKDGSPNAEITTYFVSSGNDIPDETCVSTLALALGEYKNAKSITFVDSRQRTGQYAINNQRIQDDEEDEELKARKIYPYRAGLENEAREEILEAMESGAFNGIYSTSALEIGIDVKGLNIAILATIPNDKNSYYQRIGRVGRGNQSSKSYVIIIKGDSDRGKLLFSDYKYDIDKLLPDLEPALYLDNINAQFVHAACHIDLDKDSSELSSIIRDRNRIDKNFNRYFPNSFCNLCNEILMHQNAEYLDKMGAVEMPQLRYSLRDFSSSYQIVYEDGNPTGEPSLSRQQVFSEGYQGAIRNTTIKTNGKIRTINQKVIKVARADRQILVEKFNNFMITKPQKNIALTPYFIKSRRHKTISCGEAKMFNVDLAETTTLSGYYKIIGKNRVFCEYPIPFRDTIITTGVIIFHPALQPTGVKCYVISQVLYEAFLMLNAFEPNDINYKADRLRIPQRIEGFKGRERFISLYDNNQLNISSNLMDIKRMKKMFEYINNHLDTVIDDRYRDVINSSTYEAIREVCNCFLNNPVIDEEAKDGQELKQVYSFQSDALYIANVDDLDEDGEPHGILCKILGKSKSAEHGQVTYAIFVDGNFIDNIPEENLMCIDTSMFEYYDWERGQTISQNR